jgi:hypothetical protein
MNGKFKAALTAGILFFILSSPTTYKFVDNLIGGLVTSIIPSMRNVFSLAESGCPTTQGLIVHSVVFALVVYFMMKA